MRVATGWSTHPDGAEAARAAYRVLREKLNDEPDLLIVSFSVGYDAEAVSRALRDASPAAQLHGGTGFSGAMTEDGFHSVSRLGIGLLGIVDPRGSYGSGASSQGQAPRRAAREAVQSGLAAAGRPGEMPALVWLSSAPGAEEELLIGIEDVIGSVPIAGGSTADDDVSGKWRQLVNDESYEDAVGITVMFPSVDVAYAFQSGYSPTDRAGRVTSACGRTLRTIDHRPAAEVYDEWTNGSLTDLLGSEAQVFGRTSLGPIGRVVGSVAGLPYHTLSHPESITPEGHVRLFSTVEQGQRIVLMEGSSDSLVKRAGRVAEAALSHGEMSPSAVRGALVIYCAGCMQSAGDRMHEVVDGLNDALKGKPFLGLFTFGEQGCFIGGENRHGNLMMSVVVFGEAGK